MERLLHGSAGQLLQQDLIRPASPVSIVISRLGLQGPGELWTTERKESIMDDVLALQATETAQQTDPPILQSVMSVCCMDPPSSCPHCPEWS